MSELVIQTHNFEKAKKGLKEFSQKEANELNIKSVKTNEFFGIFNHKVTGEELNTRLKAIQDHLIKLNDINNRTIKEFGQIYSALEALDNDYIKAILISIKATEKTSESIQATQEQIKKIVDDQKKTLQVLKRFKQKIDSYDHIEDIDKIWSDCKKLYKQITTLSNSISNVRDMSKANAHKVEDLKTVLKATEKNSNELSRKLNQQIVKLESITSFTSELEKIDHLKDIDEMWDSLLNAHNFLTNISNELSSFKDIASKQQSDIETLLSFIENLSSYEHLNDVDDIWSKSEDNHIRLAELVKTSERIQSDVFSNSKNIEELQEYKNHLGQIKHLNDVDDIWSSSELHSSQLCELEKQSDEIKSIVQMNKKNTDSAIASINEKNNIAVQMLTKKIKYAYLLAGGALGFAIIELIVILLGVI